MVPCHVSKIFCLGQIRTINPNFRAENEPLLSFQTCKCRVAKVHPDRRKTTLSRKPNSGHYRVILFGLSKADESEKLSAAGLLENQERLLLSSLQ